jgi:hypothetical protein
MHQNYVQCFLCGNNCYGILLSSVRHSFSPPHHLAMAKTFVIVDIQVLLFSLKNVNKHQNKE